MHDDVTDCISDASESPRVAQPFLGHSALHHAFLCFSYYLTSCWILGLAYLLRHNGAFANTSTSSSHLAIWSPTLIFSLWRRAMCTWKRLQYVSFGPASRPLSRKMRNSIDCNPDLHLGSRPSQPALGIMAARSFTKQPACSRRGLPCRRQAVLLRRLALHTVLGRTLTSLIGATQ